MKTTHDNWDYPAMHALEVQHKLNLKHGTGFRIKIKKRGGQSPTKRKKSRPPSGRDFKGGVTPRDQVTNDTVSNFNSKARVFCYRRGFCRALWHNSNTRYRQISLNGSGPPNIIPHDH
jgi:hypothetical protein